MPHVIVKMWPGRTEQQKQKLAERITKDIMEEFNCGEDHVSVAMEEVSQDNWKEQVYKPEIIGTKMKLYKQPGYKM